MTSPMIRKLEGFLSLTDEEKQALDSVCQQSIERRMGEDLILEGDRPDHVLLLLDGWAFRYKLLPDGGRQIMAYLIPGDLCDIHIFILKRMDHSIALLSDAKIGLIPEKAMVALLDTYPRIARALFWATLVDEATLREWLANALRREPFERIAHLFCELWLRMNVVGLVDGRSFDLPLTQTELGDTMGLNAVTINRVLQRLRAEELITLKGKRLVILDIDRLREISGFDPSYLHLDFTVNRLSGSSRALIAIMSQIAISHIEVAVNENSEHGLAVLNGRILVAILVRLDAAYYDQDCGSWHLEAGFGRCAGKAQTFKTLDAAMCWITMRLGLDPDALVISEIESFGEGS